jgi:hypothetical protein
MRFSPQVAVATLAFALILGGCAGSRSGYIYRATTDNCNCEEYQINDGKNKIHYRFRAHYKMDHGIVTTVEIEFINRSDDTLSLDPVVVRIASRNISYRYNNKFIPLPLLVILPGESENVILTGTDTSQQDDWNKIAGEQLTITLQGLRLGESELSRREVVFVPENPRLAAPGR